MDDRIKWLNAHADEYLRILNDKGLCNDKSGYGSWAFDTYNGWNTQRGRCEILKGIWCTAQPDRIKTGKRMCLSEHPFGTIKRAMGAGYFLLKGMRKVTGEFVLFCLGYNIERAKNLLGFDKMMEIMERA